MKLTIELLITVGIALAVIFFLVMLYFFARRRTEKVDSVQKWWAELVVSVSIVSCVWSACTVWLTIKYYRESALQSRRAAGMQFVAGYINNDKWAEYNHFRVKAMKEKWTPDMIKERIESDEKLEGSICLLLANLEVMSVAVKTKQLDEDEMYYLLRGSVLWAAKNLSSYINDQRKLRDSATYLIEFETLANSWEERISVLTGEPYPKTNDAYESKKFK